MSAQPLRSLPAQTLRTRFQIACSSEEYGFVRPDEIPIREDSPLRPLSSYGVSKVAQDLLGYQYWKSFGLHVVRTRGFNHTGPRRGEVFVTSNLARQIAEIQSGRREPVVSVGNLGAVRDFTDVRDMVRGYWLALERGEPGEVYNLCSGRGYPIGQVLEILLGFAGTKVEVREDPGRLRPSDVEILIGDCSRFHGLTGWQPRWAPMRTRAASCRWTATSARKPLRRCKARCSILAC